MQLEVSNDPANRFRIPFRRCVGECEGLEAGEAPHMVEVRAKAVGRGGIGAVRIDCDGEPGGNVPFGADSALDPDGITLVTQEARTAQDL